MDLTPAADAVKATRLNIRVTNVEKDLIEDAARATHQSASGFVMQAALRSAEAVLADRTRFVIDEAAWDEFSLRLDEPPRVIPALLDALARSDARRER